MRLRRSGPLPGADPAGHSFRPQPNRETSRGVSLAGPHFEGSRPHLVSGRSRAGVPNRLLSGVDGPHGQSKAPSRAARRRAGAFTPRGPRPRAFYVPGGLAVPRAPLTGAVRCCRQNDVMNLSRSTSDGSPWEGKPCGLSTIRSLSSSLRFVNPFFSSGEVRFWPVLEDKGSRPDQDLTPHLRLCQPPFLKEENRGEPAPEDKGPRVIRMLLPIPRPCQPLFWRRRTVVRSP